MVSRPCVRLRISTATNWQTDGSLASRISAAADRWRRFHGLETKPACSVLVESAPPEHVGLGLGTQLALSVGTGLSALYGLPAGSPQELAISVGRGLRSAVGTYGFALGGLIVEQGKLAAEPISPLDTRLSIPDSWRFLLVRPLAVRGLSGDVETAAMDETTAPAGLTEELIGEVREHLVPAVAQADFDAFSQSLGRYCQQAGRLFMRQQGGIYNGPVLTELVERLRSWGHEGVGQSSWGPTLFVALPNDSSARSLSDRLRQMPDGPELDVVVSTPNNSGARLSVMPPHPAAAPHRTA